MVNEQRMWLIPGVRARGRNIAISIPARYQPIVKIARRNGEVAADRPSFGVATIGL